VDKQATLKAHTEAGHGRSLLPTIAVRPELTSGRLELIALRTTQARMPVLLILRFFARRDDLL
jgi:hypothetical protein